MSTRNEAQREKRGIERNRQNVALRDRNRVLEAALHATWLWLSTDNTDREALRQILLTADADAKVRAALDRLEGKL